jgi:4-amino-4-deoxy-L-arabinose transferase-like glycosyltransferase
MYQRRWMLAAVVTLTVFAAVAVTYALLVPPLQNADEMYHLHYAALIANHAQLPGADFTEKQQPPLYYLIGALIIKAGGSLTALRLMSVALGVITIALVMAVARELIPGRPGIALGAGIVTASLPITVAVSASFSDDVLAWAAGAGLLWCIARVLRSTMPSRKLLLTCGIAAGIGLLSKETDWLLVVALVVAVGLRLPSRRVDLLIAVVPAAVIAGWWFVRNIATFHSLVPPLQPLTTTHPYLRSVGELKVFASGAVRSLFGPERADGGPIVRSFPVQILIGVLFAIVVVVLAVAGWQAVRQWPGFDRRSRQIVVVLAAVCALLVGEWVLNSVLFDLQPQARYLFPAVAAPATAMAWAGSIIAGRLELRSRVIVFGAVIIATILLDVDSLRVAVLRIP